MAAAELAVHFLVKSKERHSERRLRVCVCGQTMLSIGRVVAALAEALVRVPADQVVCRVVVHRNARPVLQVVQAWGPHGMMGNGVL